MLDQAVALGMSAMAVTEHGNMFSSVIFHDHMRPARHQADPRVRSVCRAGAARPEQQSADHEPSRAAGGKRRGYHNLIKLVSAGYTDGFYYKPRIDKALLAQLSKEPHRPGSCLGQGR